MHRENVGGLLVSVVVATNRGGPFLAEALGSVAAQTHDAVELIVVDDGSPDPDAIATAVREVEGRVTTRLERTEAGGVSRARNHGVRLSSGSVLAFLDDDDRWSPSRLALGLAPFADPTVVATYCGMRTIDDEGHEMVPAGQRAVAGRAGLVAGEGAVFAGNLLVRRSTFDAAGGFDARYRQAEDLDLVLTLASLGAFAHVEPTLVDYRSHGNNTTARYRELARSIRRILREHLEAATERGDDVLVNALHERIDRNDRFAAWAAARAARGSLRQGKPVVALGDLAWAMGFAPRAPALWLRSRVVGRTGRAS